MRFVFLDVGAGSGSDITGYYKMHPDNRFHHVYAFEPHPTRVEQLLGKFREIEVLPVAVGTENKKTKLFLGSNLNTSSTDPNKRSVSVDKYVDVDMIDFCGWIEKNLEKSDFITLLLDVEGTEYDLLNEMRDRGLWEWIDQMYVEFHGTKLAGFDLSVEDQLTRDLIEFYGNDVYIFRKHQHKQFLRLNKEGK